MTAAYPSASLAARLAKEPVAEAVGAEAVMEEVAALEEALQQTVTRHRQRPESSGGKYDSAVATYGIQLRAWVDMQVDARLGQLLPNFLEGELEALRAESAASREAAESAASRTEVDLQAVADAQAKLLQVVEGMSRELARNRAEGASSRESWESVSQEIQRVQDQVTALERQLSTFRGEVAEDASLKELSSFVERKFQMESHRLQGLEKELGNAEARFGTKLQELNAEASRSKLEVESKLAVVRSDLEARLDTQLAARLREQPLGRDPDRDLESKLRAVRAELEALVETRGRAADERLESRLLDSRSQVEDKLDASFQCRLEALRKECHQDAKSYATEVQVRLSEDVVALQQRLVSELRAETTAALSRESAAIAALDEQLWITDQRLGQRIDELAQSRVKERGGAKSGRLLSALLTETLEDAELPTEPVTPEATSSRRTAQRVSGGVLAAAQLAAKSLLEESRTSEPAEEDGRFARRDSTSRSLRHQRDIREAANRLLRREEEEGLSRRSSRRGEHGDRPGRSLLATASKAADAFADLER